MHAAVVIADHDREALERLCRYGTRPAFAHERLAWTADGQIAYRLNQVHKPIDAVVLEGGAGDDLLQAKGFGADVPVTLSGGAGNDTLVGGLGRDPDRLVDGGPGHDQATIDPEDRGAVRSVEDPPNVETNRVAAGKPPKARRR